MSEQQVRKVWDRAMDVRGNSLLVLLALADHADVGGTLPIIHTSYIAQQARVPYTQCSKLIRELADRGYLKLEIASIDQRMRVGRLTLGADADDADDV